MAFYHGVKTGEIPTAVIPPVKGDQPVVIVGTAPVNLSADGVGKTNEPVLCYSLADAVKAFGYSDDWNSYTLCEAMYTFFQLYAVAPVVLINVLDPARHKTAVSGETVTLDSKGAVTLANLGGILASVVVKSSDGETTYVKDTDYVAAYDDDGRIVITRVATGAIGAGAELLVSYDRLNPGAVTKADVIGGYDVTTGKYTGLELMEQIYPKFGLVPCFLIAPGFSSDSEVAAVMNAKCEAVNTVFPCMFGVDVPVATVKTYSAVSAWKNANNFVDESMVVCWPKVKLGERVFNMSTQFAALKLATDAENDGIPYKSPSNENFQMDGCTVGGTGAADEVFLSLPEANYLNSQGIVTALNFTGGWKCWGDWTACYPSVTDTKDCFIPVKAMFFWERVHLVQTYWQKVDDPMNRRLIQTLVDSENIVLNGLAAQGVLVGDGNKISFREDDNPVTELLAGAIKLHIDMTPCIPAAVIDYDLEFNVDNLSSLFD
ncbi:MAG: phage tail sheath family protein [Pyramidobacter sp.]|nr:phage tail sheath family protein [Pyramidobacter sp.]